MNNKAQGSGTVVAVVAILLIAIAVALFAFGGDNTDPNTAGEADNNESEIVEDTGNASGVNETMPAGNNQAIQEPVVLPADNTVPAGGNTTGGNIPANTNPPMGNTTGLMP